MSVLSYHIDHTSFSWLRHAARSYRLQMSLNICMGVLDVLLGLTEVWLSKQLIDAATSGRTWHFSDGGWLSLPALASMLIACMLMSVALAYSVRWLRAKLSIRSLNNLQAGEYARILRAPWLFLRKQHSGTMTNTLTDDLSAVSSFLSEQFPALVTAFVQFIGAFVFLMLLDWRLAFVIIIVTPVLVLVAQMYIRLMRRYRHEVRADQASVQAFIQESLQHSLLLQALDRVSFASSLLTERHSNLQNSYLRMTRYSALALVMVRCAFAAGYLIAFFWGVYSLSAGLITFGAMVAFIQLVAQIQQPMRTLIGYVGTFVNVSTASERIAALVPQPSSVSSMKAARPCRSADCTSQNAPIEVSNLSFTYPDAETPVIEHLSATINPGSMTAVVGQTGIGKTTFVQLLLGLLEPQEGSISVPAGGCAYVPQGNTLLSGTIRYNLLFGNPSATDDAMYEALRLADAAFVLDDARSLDYPCGERGSGLSEGQAQRIAIARALLLEAPVLLLDEAFSSLDTATAQTIVVNIRKARPEQTVICVTHREALLPYADQVIRIE